MTVEQRYRNQLIKSQHDQIRMNLGMKASETGNLSKGNTKTSEHHVSTCLIKYPPSSLPSSWSANSQPGIHHSPARLQSPRVSVERNPVEGPRGQIRDGAVGGGLPNVLAQLRRRLWSQQRKQIRSQTGHMRRRHRRSRNGVLPLFHQPQSTW